MKVPSLPERWPMPTPSLELEKRALRAELRVRVAEAAAMGGAAAGVVAAEAVVGSAAFRNAKCVALYAAFPNELPTRSLFDAILDSGKQALFPRCVAESLEFAPVGSWAELVEGSYGTQEPAAWLPGRPLATSDLVLVPGLGFDRRGGRLGRGRGYYDRTFASGAVPFLCGLAYAAQIVESVPTGSYDVQMNAIATENGWSPVETATTTEPGGA